MQEQNNIEDVDFEEVDEETNAVEELDAAIEAADDAEDMPTTFTSRQMLNMLKAAVEAGHLSKKDYKRMRSEMGIFQSDYTRKKTSDAKRKTKRKAQKQARRKQRAK
jgi:hypothetical protein